MKRKIMACALAAAMLLGGCSSGVETGAATETETGATVDMMASVQANQLSQVVDWDQGTLALTDFAVRLFQTGMMPGENTLVSPLSVVSALAMTAQGADGETLSQMESVLGLPVDVLGPLLRDYRELLDLTVSKVSLANSIWFRDDPDLTVEQSFLQTNADYFAADVYKAPFDGSTVQDINRWVSGHTDGMIQDVLSEIPEAAMLYLVNALAFDGQWQQIYQPYQVQEETFTTESGQARQAQLMYAEEHRYVCDDQAEGFVKYYKGGDCAFVALLPREGLSVADYVSGLTGQGLHQLLTSVQDTLVETALPQFETGSSMELQEVLAAMGMPDAFDVGKADFSRMGHYTGGNLLLSRVLHKTYIRVDTEGTQAGAATVVEAAAGAAPMEEEPKRVILDRPFVYMLIDCETNIPFFIGTMMDTAA